jgi:hypothetical protein
MFSSYFNLLLDKSLNSPDLSLCLIHRISSENEDLVGVTTSEVLHIIETAFVVLAKEFE